MKVNMDDLKKSAAFIKDQITDIPKIGIILGSGLGDFAESLTDKVEIPYSEIPGFKKTTVLGHAGKLVIGKLAGKAIAVMAGRNHAYEGHPIEEVVYPVRVLGTLGVESLIITNASGGINTDYNAGQLVLIKDHINMSGLNPLLGQNKDELGTRFPDMSYAYSEELRKCAISSAEQIDYNLKEGVYVGVMGPSYETPHEVKMLRVLGADMVGMSTVNETIAAVHMGIKVMGISCVTNMAAGIERGKLNHDDIKDKAAQVMKTFCGLLTAIIQKI